MTDHTHGEAHEIPEPEREAQDRTIEELGEAGCLRLISAGGLVGRIAWQVRAGGTTSGQLQTP